MERCGLYKTTKIFNIADCYFLTYFDRLYFNTVSVARSAVEVSHSQMWIYMAHTRNNV